MTRRPTRTRTGSNESGSSQSGSASSMPPPSEIAGYDPRFFRPCIFPVLRRLGYGVRPTVNNGLPAGNPNATPLSICLSIFDDEGGHLGTTGALTELAPGEIVKFDLDELLERDEVRA